jgi:hypothetical protein
MSLVVNFKDYSVRNADGTINEAETLAKAQAEIAAGLRNYIENLEHSPAKIISMIDAMIFAHRGEHLTGDWVAGEIARNLTGNKPANYSFVKRQVLGIISENSKGENPRYKSGRGRGNTGLQLVPEILQQMEIKQVFPAAAELDYLIFD